MASAFPESRLDLPEVKCGPRGAGAHNEELCQRRRRQHGLWCQMVGAGVCVSSCWAHLQLFCNNT